MGSETTRRVLEKHRAPSTHFGVKIKDLKKIQKKDYNGLNLKKK